MNWYKKVEPSDRLGPLKTWSFSGLKEFEVCAFKRFLNKVGGHRGEQHPAAVRGNEYHDSIERYIDGRQDTLPKIHEASKPFIDALRDRYANGTITLEQNWYVDINWDTCTKADDWWAVFIIDCFERESETSANITDWKTGKSRNNEMKHAEQLMLYAICAFERFPELEYINVQCAYVDEGHISLKRGYTKAQLAPIKGQFDKRAIAMTTCKAFLPNPSKYNCKWCDYKTMVDNDGNPLCMHGEI